MLKNIAKFFKKDDDPMPHALRKGKNIFCLCMIALAMFHFIVFYCMININSILMAFKEFVGIDEITGNEIYKASFGNFVTLYKDITSGESLIFGALGNTMLFFGLTCLLIPLCFIISYFLYKKLWGYRFFKVVFFLPSIISSVVLVTLYKNILSPIGPINFILREVFNFTEFPSLLTNDKYAKWVILLYCAWTGFGVNVVLYQGAMTRIPESVIEAAKLDGVSEAREMVSIITPMMWPTLSTTLILAFTSIFTASGPNLLFIPVDGEQYGTMTISYWIFNSVQGGSYEYPSAVGLVFTVIGLPIVLGIRAGLNKLFDDVEY